MSGTTEAAGGALRGYLAVGLKDTNVTGGVLVGGGDGDRERSVPFPVLEFRVFELGMKGFRILERIPNPPNERSSLLPLRRDVDDEVVSEMLWLIDDERELVETLDLAV